ncbi:hypothetical protein [Streptomyces sp. NPDC091027]|uniref:hypothetical protein n=1 Tax=Streptomyces sp. NPDC091027 TaxID=3365971 RepID=UPI003804E20D
MALYDGSVGEVAMVAGVEDTGAIAVLKAVMYGQPGPFVRDREDVPHEGALPDLYSLEAELMIEQAIEEGRLRWSVNLNTGETVLSRRSKFESNE